MQMNWSWCVIGILLRETEFGSASEGVVIGSEPEVHVMWCALALSLV